MSARLVRLPRHRESGTDGELSRLERIVLPNIRHGHTPGTALAGLLLTAAVVTTMLVAGITSLRGYYALTTRGRTATVLVTRVNEVKGGPTANVRYLTGPVGHEALLDRLPSPPPQVNRSIEVRYDPRKPDSVSASGVGLFPGGTVAIAVAFVIIGSVVLLAEWRLWRRLQRERLPGSAATLRPET